MFLLTRCSSEFLPTVLKNKAIPKCLTCDFEEPFERERGTDTPRRPLLIVLTSDGSVPFDVWGQRFRPFVVTTLLTSLPDV